MGEPCLHGQRWCCMRFAGYAEQLFLCTSTSTGLDAVHRTGAGDQHTGMGITGVRD